GGFLEGERSLVADEGPMVFREYASDARALAEASGFPAVRRLQWFNRGFMKSEVREGRLVLSDLRMGAEPDYSFRFVVAERAGGAWREIVPGQIAWPWEARRRLSSMWERIWERPAEEAALAAAGTMRVQAAAAKPGETPAASASK